jgi:AcrR family transcriptional regulator
MAMTENVKKRRPRDPVATRAVILEAACTLLSRDGPDGVTLSAVALLAGVNRGTAYQHFETREKLVEATVQMVSDRIFREVFGDPETIGERQVEQVDMVEVTERLAYFAMENPELCRSWFLQVLSLPDPTSDPFWREYSGSIGRFARTDLAEPGIDAEAWSIISLAGNFLWPVWAHSHSQGADERRALAKRFAHEMLRLSMYGTINTAKFPKIAAQLADEAPARPALRAAG